MYGFEFTKSGYKQKLRSPIEKQYAQRFTNSVVDFLYKLETESDGKFRIVKSYADLEKCLKNRIFAIVLHFEGAEVINEDLSNLHEYYNKGLRAMGIVWSRPNAFGCGVPFQFPHSPDIGEGLTIPGKNLVKECNKLGILIDLVHINEKGFWAAAELSTKPLVVTHTDVYAICPSTRNLTDEQIDLIGDSGGVIGINFEPVNTSFEPKLVGKMPMDKLVRYLNNLPLSSIIKHISYVAERIGIDHVALGSDFDGAEMPDELKDVSGLPRLVYELEKSGFDKKSIEKICYKNWLRVLKQTWKV